MKYLVDNIKEEIWVLKYRSDISCWVAHKINSKGELSKSYKHIHGPTNHQFVFHLKKTFKNYTMYDNLEQAAFDNVSFFL